MPPLKNVTNKKLPAATTTVNKDIGMTTRRKGLLESLKGENVHDPYIKRKAEASPLLKKTTKRSAFGDLTNALDKKNLKKPMTAIAKPTTVVPKPSIKPVIAAIKPLTSVVKPVTVAVKPATTVTSRKTRTSSTSNVNNVKTNKPSEPLPKVSVPARKPSFLPPTKAHISTKLKSEETKKPILQRKSSGRLSSDLEKSGNSLYVSALDEILDETVPPTLTPALPEPEINIDKEYWNDSLQVSMYAHEIFNYLKSRESHYVIKEYMHTQKGINAWMRSLLIDWLVEVQENFELNHETLYLAVKLVDMYLGKYQVTKKHLQLVGAASMLVAAKYDERIPPSIDDFIYICDGAYEHCDITRMEVKLLKAIDFNLGIPLSYRFLRRYARCAKVQMPLLTLARFILEYSLMDYSTITFSDSKIASAALYLAIKMKKEGDWSSTLQYFSGYKTDDFKDIALHLNSILHEKPKESLSTVRNKYSHKIFFEVAKTPLIDNNEL